MAFTPFHSWGKLGRDYPLPFFCCWLAVLITGIVLFPLRAERTDDVINSWLPEGGQARLARDFVADIWKHQAAVKKYPDLQSRLEGMGYHVNDDGFFRNTRKYFIIWGSDKGWDYKEDTNGDSILTKAHYEEWYNFNKQLWTDPYEVDGEQQSYKDLCATSYGSNAWHVGDAIKANASETDTLGQRGMLLFRGWNPLFQKDGQLWLTLNLAYPDTGDFDLDNADILHNELHSQFVIQATAGPLVQALLGLNPMLKAFKGFELAACEDDSKTDCIRMYNESMGISSDQVTQYNYNYNCATYMEHADEDTYNAVWGAGNPFTGKPWTHNQITNFCANLFVYSSIPDSGTEYENPCHAGDITFCVWQGLSSHHGTIFQEPYVAGFIENYKEYPTEEDFTNDDVDDAAFLSKLDQCAINPFLTSNNGRYIRSSKNVGTPDQLARRLQIKNGECELKHPSAELQQAMWDAIAHSDAIKAAEQTLGKESWKKLHACQEYASLAPYALYMQQAFGAGQMAEAAAWAATIDGYGYDSSNATAIQIAIDTSKAICSEIMDLDTNPVEPTYLPGFYVEAGKLEQAVTAVGTGAGTWGVWYKSSIYFDCPEYTDDAIKKAMSYRDTVFDQMQVKVEEFNKNSVHMRAAVLSNKTEKEGYENLYDQNIILSVVGLVIFFIMVVVLQWKNKEVAFISVFLILMCVAATFGFMPPPYTPSVLQFLPYLSLGIGVDDLFVVLHHYNDEDNIPKAIHHSGPTITMTSLVNLCCFLALYIISNVPDFTIFTTAAAISVGLLWGNVMFGFVPLLCLIERCKGKDLDLHRPGDDFDEEKDLDSGRRTSLTTQLGDSGHRNYVEFSRRLEPLKSIGTVLCVLFAFIASVVLAVMKIQGWVFDEIDFGLQLSQLVYEDIDDHAYRSVMILERFPLYSIECGANKEWDSSKFLDNTWDNYAPDFIDFFQGMANLQDTSYSSLGWAANVVNNGTHAYPYYTDMARTYPILPSQWNYWYDWDHATQTDMVVPESTIYIRPTTADARGIVPGRDITKAVDRLYDYLEQDKHKNIGVYCTSNILQVYERYINVEADLLKGFVISAIIVFVVGIIMIQDIGATLILTIVTMATAFELWGFYGFASLRINSFLTLCITLGAAFTVQYTAHLNRRFVVSKAPTRWYRMVDALSAYAAPIVYGGMTTAVAVSAAAFLPAKYFRLYFFYSFVIMVAFGLFNGLLVQSALLVLIPINMTAYRQDMFGDDKGAGRRYSGSGDEFEENMNKRDATKNIEMAPQEYTVEVQPMD